MNSKFNSIRTTGVLQYVDDLFHVAHAMVDDCRFCTIMPDGDNTRVGGKEEEALLKIEENIDALRNTLKEFVAEYC